MAGLKSPSSILTATVMFLDSHCYHGIWKHLSISGDFTKLVNEANMSQLAEEKQVNLGISARLNALSQYVLWFYFSAGTVFRVLNAVLISWNFTFKLVSWGNQEAHSVHGVNFNRFSSEVSYGIFSWSDKILLVWVIRPKYIYQSLYTIPGAVVKLLKYCLSLTCKASILHCNMYLYRTYVNLN